MLNWFLHADQELFLWLNHINSPFFDSFFSVITNKYTWIPLYLFLIGLLIKKYKSNGFFIKLLYVIAAVGASDYVASGLLKPFFERARPCHNSLIKTAVHVVDGCGGSFGFVSSHAANSFAVAVAISLLMKSKRLTNILVFWAILVAYSRIYVGVHYPLDIIFGALLGTAFAFIFYPITKLIK